MRHRGVKKYTHNCECCDPGCPVHKGKSQCKNKQRCTTFYRIDMEDLTGTKMCPGCGDDAMNSGLFRTRA